VPTTVRAEGRSATFGEPASDLRGPSAAAERRRELATYWAYLAAERLINLLPRSVVLPLATAAGNVVNDIAVDKRRVVR
jgi:hypothetical protein